MGSLNDGTRLPTKAIEWPLPWGSVVRGVRIGDGLGAALLLHEPGTDLDSWRELPGWLAHELPLTVVALDLPGHGLSDDPWEPGRLPELVREALPAKGRGAASPGATPHPNPSPTAAGEGLVGSLGTSDPGSPPSLGSDGPGALWATGQGGEGVRPVSTFYDGLLFLIAAGATATTALELASDLSINGIVCLSPEAPDPQSDLVRSPRVPKLIVAGSLAENDLQTARQLGSRCGGWTVVTSFPVATRGTGLLASRYATQLVEAITAFLRDCATRPAQARMPAPQET